ncbi:ribonuclease HII [Sporolactobacillus sp. THM19-2]|jgi:ribonuclease HII|uniref:ribonuclease HII n=1 Tax=Sporolactobacillus sp. THM19-2 TaxID=2511171 RepID=UPI0010212372|nr:ribonuclease HII [Sporolactobacillus sp. THM19-2]RYL92934.1 ribonuclease HII [Sporolactobacillus sp. THM19-2]
MQYMTVAQIKEKLQAVQTLSPEDYSALEHDSRAGVRHLIRIWERKQQRRKLLIEKFDEMNRYERELWDQGFQHVAGIDEAGRGPLAGPVVAACVILGTDTVLPGLNDSKQLTPSKRDLLYRQIRQNALSVSVGMVSAREIDSVNIYQAARRSMVQAVKNMKIKPDYLLIDAMRLPLEIDQSSLIKGDARSNSIAAASIIAKVTRDRLMNELDQVYPGYGFSGNKGYGTKEHVEAIRKLGPCPEHRMTFAPLKS